MMKKILFWLLIIFNVLLVQGQITLTTTSSSGNWSPTVVANSGNQLVWTAADNSAAGGTFTGQVENADDPIFDFSSNNGTPIVITISNTGNDFSGLTTLSFNGDLESGDISVIDIANATFLIDFGINYNNLSILDLTQNDKLEALNIRGNQQLYNQTLDISNNLNLRVIMADNSGINALDVSINTLINDVRLYGARLTSEVMDQLLIDLDNHGLSNGNIEIRSQKGGDVLTYQSKTAYLSLISKGWSIDVLEPPAEDMKTITLITNATSSVWRLDRVYNYGAVLHWEATNSLIGTITADQYDNEIAPTFDFSANDGSPITITITSNEGFNGLDQLNFNNEAGNINSEITNADIANAVNLGSYAPFNSSLTNIDVSNNTKLYRILIHGDVRQLVGQSLNTDNNPGINHVRIDNTGIVSVDFTNNPLLNKVWLMDASLTSSVMDNVVITLDQHGLSVGDLRFANQTTGDQLTSVSYVAYNSLIAKGWTIDVAVPPAPPKLEMTGNGNAILSGNTASTTDGTDFEDVAVNVLLAHTFTITNSGDEDLIITAVSVIGATEFTTDLTAQTIAAGASLDFEATFLPTATGQIGADIVIDNNDSNFTLHVEGRGIIGTGSDIDIQGGSPLTSILGDGTNSPSTTDGTDFGQVAAGGTITETFTIENKGDQSLDLTGSPDLVAITGANASDFTISVLPTTPIAVGATTTFEVTFNANSLGIRAATLTVVSNDPNDPSYVFNIQAESTQASGPEINVTGNGQSIPSDNTPIIADDTDFGQVEIGSSVTKTFTIENLGNSDLTITGVYGVSPPYEVTVMPNSPIVSGSSTIIEITYTPQNIGNNNVQVVLTNNDSDENPYLLNLTGEGTPTSFGTIDVQGNGISIINGDTTPDIADDTDFGQVINNTSKTNTFIIYNTGTTDLTISNIDFVIGGDTEFTFNNLPAPNTVIPVGGQPITFDVVFSPTIDGIYNAFVKIDNSDDTPFQFKIQGEGAGVVVSGDIMITQYYSGFNVTDKWIEIKNISGSDIPAGTYFLALYDQDDIPDIATQAPTASESIPFMATNDVLLFRPNSVPAKPSSTNIGTATQISTTVCNFDGDDVILLSTTNDTTCYGHREDIIGDVPVVPSNPWGLNASFIKGGCASEQPHANFDINDWTRIPLNEIDIVDTNTNLALGTQFFGPTNFDGTNWSNGFPDRSRTVIFSNSFSHANQTISACNLIVNSGITAEFNSNGSTNNSIVLYGDLTTNGSLIIGDTESVVTLGDNPTLGTITKIERSNILDNIHDNTYWSSPVLGSQISTIFTDVDITRIFEYQAGNPNPAYPAGVEYQYWWNKPNGSMNIGFGYAVEGPSAPVDSNDNYITPFEHELTFIGIPFTGTKELDLFYSGSPDVGIDNNNFNLIGNPYPTAIDIDKFFDDNGNVREIALWTHSTPISGGEFTKADYVTYNRDGSTEPQGTVITNNIGSGQGFMARTTSDTNIRFLDSHKMIGVNDQFFKSSNSKVVSANNEFEGDKIWLEMSDNTGYRSSIMIGFSHKATDGLDSDYDSYGYVMERDIKLYSSIDQEISKFVIQNLGSFSADKKVSIGIDNKNTGDFKISIIGKLGALKDTEVYLVDHLLNVTHDLKASDYQFEQTATGEFPNRFTLQFAGQALDVDDEIFAKNEFVIINDLDGFKIHSAQEVKDIKVYDLLGRMIIHKQPNKKSFYLNTTAIKNGTVLVVKATLENGSIINKKTIKY